MHCLLIPAAKKPRPIQRPRHRPASKRPPLLASTNEHRPSAPQIEESQKMTQLQKFMQTMDAQADQTEDRSVFWQSASLLLCVWSSGGVPAGGFTPTVAPDLFAAFKKIGPSLRTAVDARAFAI